ncbi:MAG TPA: VWA domain-containing protein [Gammaproteobacteria bacterium]|nr:VWA domain-containing protein [Gammaproteobacteria bacterium]
MKRRKGELNVFSMSFLDAITAGFGCVVLLFMLVSANAVLDQRTVVEDREAEARRWELRVLTGQRNLVQLREALEVQIREWTNLLAMRQGLITQITDTEVQLATLSEDSEARRAAIERLRQELAELNKQSQELVTNQREESEDAQSLRAFQGEGNRQYLTGLRMGGRHVVILVDTSTSMLDRTIVNILRRRNMSPEQQRRAPKWQQAVNTVDWLTTQIPAGTNVQVIGFADKPTWLIPGTEGQWVTVNDGSELDAPVEALRASYPQGPTSLHAAFNAIKMLEPKPDNIYLLTDGLPTMGDVTPTRAGVRADERMDHFERAIRQLPVGVPVNTLLFAMEGDPHAAWAYWLVAIRTGGSMMAPSEDWP